MIEPDDDCHRSGDIRSLIKYVMWYLVRCRNGRYVTIRQFIENIEIDGELDED